jgi:16S rRNA (guanine527-N7)-methyltransferase
MNLSPEEIVKALSQGIEQFGLHLPIDKLLQYLTLLHKWNHAYNLTAIRDMDLMVTRHVLDSLAVIPWVKGARMLDVGSGAGLPGIPLALALPQLHVVLLDSNGKKIRFLQEVKRALSLSNVEIIQSRAENYHPPSGFDTVISRAFSDLSQMIAWTRHLIAPEGIWLAMKGRRPDAELQTLHFPYRVETYAVAGIDSERCCIIVDKI